MMKLVVLLALLVSPVCDGSKPLIGREGDDITLPCKYDIKYHGPLSVCWSRGELPSRGCGQVVASTDGLQVTGSAPSSRLRLLGRLEDGDVSLTILKVSLKDAGRYGCRVEIPGLFNDQIHHFDLEVRPAPQTTTLPPETPSVTTEQEEEGGGHATGHVTSTELLQTSSSSSSSSNSSSSSSSSDSSSQSAENGLILLLCLLFGFLALIIAVALIIVVRMKRLNKLPQQQIRSRTGSRTGSGSAGSGFSLQLRTRDSVVENVYQIEEEGGDYESISSAH